MSWFKGIGDGRRQGPWEAPNPNGEGQRWETAKGSRMKLAF